MDADSADKAIRHIPNDTGKTVGNFLTSIATKAFAGNVNNIGTWNKFF